MLASVGLRSGIVTFLTDRTFAAPTARDADRRLWTSPLIGVTGFLDVASPTTRHSSATDAQIDPLETLVDQVLQGLVDR